MSIETRGDEARSKSKRNKLSGSKSKVFGTDSTKGKGPFLQANDTLDEINTNVFVDRLRDEPDDSEKYPS